MCNITLERIRGRKINTEIAGEELDSSSIQENGNRTHLSQSINTDGGWCEKIELWDDRMQIYSNLLNMGDAYFRYDVMLIKMNDDHGRPELGTSRQNIINLV